ncbi:MAG TPA: TonB-dependent receptor [Candidatus Omnitrophota bacterium]|nr:TonB-dependent receptor [Candidatus Omnitrophota bacterium]
MKNLLKILFVGIFILIGSLSSAVEVPFDQDLGHIVVTSSRVEENSSEVTRNVDVITAKDIQKSQAKNLAEALSKLANVNIKDSGGLSALKTVSMRGATASQVLILQDGRPLNSPRDGQIDLSAISLDSVKRIEVLRGAGASLYGSGAMGGTINIITKQPPKEGQKTEISTGFGTFKTYQEKISHGAKVGNLGYLINAGYLSSEGFRKNSEKNSKDVDAKFTYQLNESNSLIFNTGFLKSKVGAPGSMTYTDDNDKQFDLKNFQDLNWKFSPDDTTAFSVKAYQTYSQIQFLENTTDGWFADNQKDTHTTKSRGLDFQLSKNITENYQTIVGFNPVWNINDSTSSSKHDYSVLSGYMQNKWDVLENLRLDFGARVDDYSNFGTELNPSLSFLYSATDWAKLRGSISRSFRAPTFNELYWPDEGPWGSKGNENVKPEKGISKEIGVETEINKFLKPSVAYFRNDYKDLISWTQQSSLRYEPLNINKAVVDGIEFNNKMSLTDHWSFDGGFTFLRAKDKETHKYLTYQPKHQATFALKYDDGDGLVCELNNQMTGVRFDNAANTAKVKGFSVLSFDISKKFKSGVTYFVNIDNLLAKKYQVQKDYPMPGFSIMSGVKYEF